MKFRNNPSLVLRIFFSTLLIGAVFASPANALELPPSQKVLFILDVSGSTNSAQLWKQSLRPSLIKKLVQPFGYPLSKGFKYKAPLDISVTTVQTNSIDSPVFDIINTSDAELLWASIFKAGRGNPTQALLKQINSDVFSGTGAWTKRSAYLNLSKIIIPSLPKCIQSTLNDFKNSSSFNHTPLDLNKEFATAVCRMSITIGNRILKVDNYFKNPKCEFKSGNSPKTCSDIVGAILRASTAAPHLSSDEDSDQEAPIFCIAIASDMLNKSLGVASDSPLDSRYVATHVKSTQDARNRGTEAAKLADIRFPMDIQVKISILGQGTGPSPLPLDKNSYLKAYWDGFWDSAGVKDINVLRSFDEACS